MKVVGIDPSSSLSGVALLDCPWNGTPTIEWTKTWEKDKSKSGAENLHNYFTWLKSANCLMHDIPDSPWSVPVAQFACVEFLSVMRNADTNRKVSHYQAASVLACKELGMTVVEARVSSARKEALGNGGLSKDEAWERVRKLYPRHKFRRKTSGGTDEADAVVLALAGRGLAER